MIIEHAHQLEGVFTALFTPLKSDDPKRLNNSIDFDKSKTMIDDLINAGITGIVPSGTTGQSATLSNAQHLEFIQFVVEHVNGRVPIIAGAGSNCTRESVEMINKIQTISPVPVLCVTGYYNNPTQDGVKLHYETLAAETDAKIVMYNVPCRTLSYIEPETAIALAENSSIIGMKQAVSFQPDGEHYSDTQKVADETKELDFTLISGEDDSFFHMLSIGGKSIITATGNIPEAAQKYLQIKEQFEAGEPVKAQETQDSLSSLVQACFCLKNPIPLGTLFNSPLYQPMSSVRETSNGEALYRSLMDSIKKEAASLLKFH
ncbi:MAG: dihydrodipicolinate synthase family protein [Fibrobacterales bacterium]